MKHRNNGGQRRYQNNAGGNRGQNDAGNIQRQKHHATQQLSKYNDMARNAQINGDRVDVEYYLQHVEHYSRVLTDIAVIEAERYAHQREQQIVPGGPNDPNAQEYHANQQEAVQQDASAAPQQSIEQGEQEATGDASQAAPVVAAPRQRQPRRHYTNTPAAPEHSATETNGNTGDIPLPDSILPPV